MTNNCKWCDKPLLNTKNPRRKFCNDKCRSNYRRAHANDTGTYEVSCHHCGKQFRTYNPKKIYCSSVCRKLGRTGRGIQTKVQEEKECNECGKRFVGSNSYQRFCSGLCKRRYNNRINEIKRRTYYAKGDHTITLGLLVSEEKNVCYLCGQQCNWEDYYINEDGRTICGNNYPSVDHFIPLSKGGSHERGNIHLAHIGCNRKKSDKLL